MTTVKERLDKLEKDNRVQFRFIQAIIAAGTGKKENIKEATESLKKELNS